jgi:hypothetical protein
MHAAELYGAVLLLAGERQLQVIHGLPRVMLARGWPDVVITGPGGGVLFRKLLDENGKPGRNSRAVLDYLYAGYAGYADAGIWRPQDLWSGEIEAQLDRIRGEAAVAYLACQECSRPFARMGRNHKYCPDCQGVVKRRQTLESWRRAQARKAAQGSSGLRTSTEPRRECSSA